MKTESILPLVVIVAAAVLLWGCSDLKTDSQVASPFVVDVHPSGFASSSSANFHGTAVQNAGWEMRNCRQCHGGSYTGSNAPSCISSGCHVDANGNAKSPESCNTCHGNFSGVATDTASWAPPRTIVGDTVATLRGVGAHQDHLNPRDMSFSSPVACSNCHNVPSSVYVQGHFDSPLPARVSFTNPLASTRSGGLVPAPGYDPQSLSCNNTFCHGNWRLQKSTSQNKFVYADSVISGANFTPHWTGGDPQGACGTCHGLPPSGHLDFGANAPCTSCHYLDPNKQSGPLDKSIHINGKIDLYGQEYSFR